MKQICSSSESQIFFSLLPGAAQTHIRLSVDTIASTVVGRVIMTHMNLLRRGVLFPSPIRYGRLKNHIGASSRSSKCSSSSSSSSSSDSSSSSSSSSSISSNDAVASDEESPNPLPARKTYNILSLGGFLLLRLSL